MKLIIRDLDNNIVDVINCNYPIAKSIEETKKISSRKIYRRINLLLRK